MSDIKLFRLTNGSAEELVGKPVKLEKRLQTLIEKHIETFLHVRFVASEYSTGKTHAGRIDTRQTCSNERPSLCLSRQRFCVRTGPGSKGRLILSTEPPMPMPGAAFASPSFE